MSWVSQRPNYRRHHGTQNLTTEKFACCAVPAAERRNRSWPPGRPSGTRRFASRRTCTRTWWSRQLRRLHDLWIACWGTHRRYWSTGNGHVVRGFDAYGWSPNVGRLVSIIPGHEPSGVVDPAGQIHAIALGVNRRYQRRPAEREPYQAHRDHRQHQLCVSVHGHTASLRHRRTTKTPWSLNRFGVAQREGPSVPVKKGMPATR